MNGKERRNLKSIAKVRPVDLKIGKKGLTETFLNEARKILSRDGMIKFSHSLVREDRNDLVSKIEPLLSVNLVEKVGKTLTFSQVAQ
jgi:RNA-binding protein YhbY